MPAEGIPLIDHKEILTYEEILRIVKAGASIGIKKIRLTGGEPLLRKGIVNLVASIKSIEGIQEVAITTNGLLLDAMLDDLIRAGLDRVNLSLDTLDEKKFETISRFKGLDKILRGLEGCMARHIPVKINAVALKGINDQEVDDLIKLTYKWSVDVRFIELMPIGCGKSFTGVSTDDLYNKIGQLGYDYHRVDISRGNGPADYIQLRGALGKVGFISPLSHQFCHTCNRIRITPEGFLKPCLHAKTGIDMKRALRSNITDEALVELLEEGIMMKPTSHKFLDQSVDQDVRSMNQIGG
jgi:cyclic pyranopterin phosphate synthase